MRFRRRIRIAPGLHINISGRGLSTSVGPRGASLTFSSRGVFANTGIPGTGLHQRQRLDRPSQRLRETRKTAQQLELELVESLRTLRIEIPLGGGDITLRDGQGAGLPSSHAAVAWKHLRDDIVRDVEQACKAVATQTDALATLHTQTPSPSPPAVYSPTEYGESPPIQPTPVHYHWLGRLFRFHRHKVDACNAHAKHEYEAALAAYRDGHAAHLKAEESQEALYHARNAGVPDATEALLAQFLQALDWPKETLVEMHFDTKASVLYLDVDLPEIEDLPDGVPQVTNRGRSIKLKLYSEAAKRRLYMSHVHAVLFRLVGEAFHVAPSLRAVIVSGYSQRRDPATGQERSDYLISVRVPRAQWEQLDFSSLAEIDPVHAMAAFDLVRSMTKTGIFRPIQPLAPDNLGAKSWG